MAQDPNDAHPEVKAGEPQPFQPVIGEGGTIDVGISGEEALARMRAIAAERPSS